MKRFFLSALVFLGLGMAATFSPAQTNGAGQGGSEGREHQLISFLSKADQDRVISAYDKAMADNADLKSAQEDLRKGSQGMMDADDATRAAFMDKVQDYQKKVRVAMLKEDPKLGPVLDEIEKHRAEMMKNGAAGGGPGQ